MKNKDIDIAKEQQDWFPKIKAYSVEEVMAAGGPEAFGEKTGKVGKIS